MRILDIHAPKEIHLTLKVNGEYLTDVSPLCPMSTVRTSDSANGLKTTLARE